MFGLMRNHQEHTRNLGRVIAEMPVARAKSAASGQTSGKLAGQQLAAFLSASLTEDLAALKRIAATERKEDFKRETLLPKYAPYIARLKESGQKHDLLGYWLVWLFDAGSIDDALEYAAWCLGRGVGLPERFQSDIRFFIAAQVVNWAEKEIEAGRSIEPYWGWLHTQAEQEPEVWNLPDELAGRLCRVKGLEAFQQEDYPVAKFYLESALKLGAKVKTKLEQVDKKLAGMALPEMAMAEPAQGEGDGDESPESSPATT